MTIIEAFLTYPFLQRALLAGVIVALLASLIGVFVVLRRMAFFSDAMAHITLAGIAIGLLLGWLPFYSSLIVCVLAALGISFLMDRGKLAADTAIGVFFSSAAALGVLIINLLPRFRGDLVAYLFGDVLSVTLAEIWIALILLVLVIGFIVLAYSPFVRTIFVRDIAKTDGINTRFYEYVFMGLLAIVVAASVKIVGVILVSALIVLPAATARNLSNSLKQMFGWSMVVAVFSAIIGLGISYLWNLATGPTIVLVSAAFFIISYGLTYLQGRIDSN